MSLSEEVSAVIRSVIPDAEVYVFDPDGQHLEGIVVSAEFMGMPLVKQHQKVLLALKETFATSLHALQLKTFTPEKWLESDLRKNVVGRV
jgi:acid stress-induced BolA-like protein IbaG/YrbA